MLRRIRHPLALLALVVLIFSGFRAWLAIERRADLGDFAAGAVPRLARHSRPPAAEPTVAAFSDHRLANEIAGNGMLSLAHEAVQRWTGTPVHTGAVLDPLPPDEAVARARRCPAPPSCRPPRRCSRAAPITRAPATGRGTDLPAARGRAVEHRA